MNRISSSTSASGEKSESDPELNGLVQSADVLRLVLFSADVGVVAFAGWLIVRALGDSECGLLETGVAWLLSLALLVVGGGVILGLSHGFSALGFLVIHLGAGMAMVGARRHLLRADLGAAFAQLKAVRGLFEKTEGRVPALALLAAMVVLTVASAWFQPAIFDTLNYRLPRLAHWLQEGRIEAIASADSRMTFVADGWEVAVAWILGISGEGYRPWGIIQAVAGWLTVGATTGLARETGLSRTASLMAGALIFGMGNVVIQFSAPETDLLTAGTFAAAFYLWLRALRRKETPVLGCLGVGLSLAIKGTLFYFAPAALIWVGWLGWKHRLTLRQWLLSILAGVLGLTALPLPGYLLNFRVYGNLLGPDEMVAKHHRGGQSGADLLEKLRLNLAATLAQNFEPHAQPWPLREISRQTGMALAATLPSRDPYALDGIDRQSVVRTVLNKRQPDADIAAFGFVIVLLFAVAVAVALVRSREPSARLVLLWAAGVLVFWLFFHGMHQWHQYAFRYQVLVAPWLAVVGAWGLSRLPAAFYRPVCAVALLGVVSVACHLTFYPPQSGWNMIAHAEGSLNYYTFSGWREWSRQLDGPLRLALPAERPVAAFYRQGTDRPVVFERWPISSELTAEQLVPPKGWLIVPANRFIGNEGQVVGRTWLFNGDERHPMSLAAYRKSQSNDLGAPLLYRHRKVPEGDGIRHELLVKTWNSDPVRFAIRNVAGAEGTFVVTTHAGQQAGHLLRDGETRISFALPEGQVSGVSITVRSGNSQAAAGIEVELVDEKA